MTKEIFSEGRDRGVSGRVKELQTLFINPLHTRALSQVVSRDPEFNSRDAIIETVFGREPGGIPQRAPQKAFTLLSSAIGELRRNRKKLTNETEKGILDAIDTITELNDGKKAAIYHLLRERVGMAPQGFHGVILPENTDETLSIAEQMPSTVTPEEVRNNLKEQINFVGSNPTLADWVHVNVLRTRFRRELHGMKLDRGNVPKPDEGGFYSSVDAAIIFCLAEFKGRKLPKDLDMKRMVSEILRESS